MNKSYLKYIAKYDMENDEIKWQKRKVQIPRWVKKWILRHFCQDFCQTSLLFETKILCMEHIYVSKHKSSWKFAVLLLLMSILSDEWDATTYFKILHMHWKWKLVFKTMIQLFKWCFHRKPITSILYCFKM